MTTGPAVTTSPAVTVPVAPGTLVVGLDADDTLWRCEDMFAECEQRLRDLLTPWADGPTVDRHVIGIERERLRIYGYGVKGFILSMVEAAVAISDGAIGAPELGAIVGWGREILDSPLEMMPGVVETMTALAEVRPLLLITKGDHHHQRRKIIESGLDPLLIGSEVLDDKTPAAYQEILDHYGIAAEDFVMVGNSVRSDIEPVLELGAAAIHIPYHITWALEQHDKSANQPANQRWHTCTTFTELPQLLSTLTGAAA